jgi:hypothetical protein
MECLKGTQWTTAGGNSRFSDVFCDSVFEGKLSAKDSSKCSDISAKDCNNIFESEQTGEHFRKYQDFKTFLQQCF